MAFILIQHLDPNHESMMMDLLAGHTPMTVQQATDGVPIESNHVYVIPPGTYLSVSNGALHLSQPQARHGARLPFDFLLYSLAENCGPGAICVVLSGTGADGTTLRFLVHWLRLDRLSRIDQALRHQVVALGLGTVRDRLRQTAAAFGFLPQAAQRAVDRYERRAAAEAAANTFDAALTDRDRLKLGLLTFASQERAILLEIFRERGLSRAIMEQLLPMADAIIDATRADGRLGYLHAARGRLRPSRSLWLAQWLHRRFRIDQPLTRLLAQRLEMLLVMQMVFRAQLQFMRERMTPVLGARVTEVMGEIVQRRRALLDDATEALGLLYPAYADVLQTRMLRRIGLRFEMDTYVALRDEALLSEELFREISRDIEARRDAAGRPMTFDLQAGLIRRVSQLPPFATLPEARLRTVARTLTLRFALPSERILRRRRRAASVYLISSGEIEIDHDGKRLRLPSGAMFGGDGLLGEAQTEGAVTAVRFCLLLVLRTGLVRKLLDSASMSPAAPVRPA